MEQDDGVRYAAASVARRLAERLVMQAQFWQRFAGLEAKVASDVVALFRR
jgi:hypothetical protein